MAIAAFTRLTERILAHVGEDAILRGEVVDPPRKINVEHGVELTGVYGEVTAYRSLATIEKAWNPQPGDPLTVDGKDYILDVLLKDNGYSAQFVLRDA